MKKQTVKLSVLALIFAMLAGCAANSPVVGSLYTGVKHSGISTGGILDNSVKSLKTGVSSCTSVLGLIAAGDCSEETARRNGGITKVNSVAHETTSFYIFFNHYKTIVTGE